MDYFDQNFGRKSHGTRNGAKNECLPVLQEEFDFNPAVLTLPEIVNSRNFYRLILQHKIVNKRIKTKTAAEIEVRALMELSEIFTFLQAHRFSASRPFFTAGGVSFRVPANLEVKLNFLLFLTTTFVDTLPSSPT